MVGLWIFAVLVLFLIIIIAAIMVMNETIPFVIGLLISISALVMIRMLNKNHAC